MPTRRYFSNFAPRQTLANSIGSADTSCQIAGSFAGWPTQFPFYATLGYGLSSAEIVSVANIVGTTATIARAQNGSVAVAHSAGETMDQTAIAQDFDEANAHASATTGVHGISGSVVGTTDAQTLTNKTLTAPVINGANIVGATGITTGDLTATGVSTVDSLTVNGAITLADGLPEKTTTDWNTATLPGLYTAGPASANAPTNSSLSGLVVNVGGSTQQIAWDGAGNEWRRVYTGTWSSWNSSEPELVVTDTQPSSPVAGLFWLAQTAKTLEIWDGSQWQTLLSDTGWVNVPLASGYAAYSSSNTPQYRVKNGVVYFQGWVKPSSGTFAQGTVTISGALPSAYWPADGYVIRTAATDSGVIQARLYIPASGGILEVGFNASGANYVDISALSYPLG